MSVLDWIRKGFGYMLLTMGVSRPAPKPKQIPPGDAPPGPKTGQ
jgi:hypothetical protein